MNIIHGEKKAQKHHSRKLCGTFLKKEKYVIHFANLKFYLEEGLKLDYIHKVIQFEQEDFIQPFITKMTLKRASAKTEFKKQTAKLIANAIYGRWLMNVRKHIEVKFATRDTIAQKWIGSPRCNSFRIINPNLVAIFLSRKCVTLDKNYLVGFSILELSKLALFRTYYRVIQPALGVNNVSVVMSDTDSIIMHCKDRSKKDVLQQIRYIMDFSNLERTHEYFSEKRKQIPGFMKDENPKDDIVEFVAPKSKCYILRLKNLKDKKQDYLRRCKGISRSRANKLLISTYRDCVHNKKKIKVLMTTIQNRNTVLHTTTINKICMSSFDDKRYLFPCGIHSVPYGSVQISMSCTQCQK